MGVAAPARRPRRGAAALLVLGALAGCDATDPSGPATSAPPASSPSPGSTMPEQWLGYHADQARTGAVPGGLLRPVRRAWTASLGGAVRGQPLVVDGRVVAATETNRVVALDPQNGHVLWSVSLGRPLTDVPSVAGCGNIDPLGITSTAVADPATHTVYVVAEIDDGGGRVRHSLAGLDVATGATRVKADVDPPLPAGETPVHLLQRASLALAGGRVYVPYGGNLGDCGKYHGWVVGAETGDPTRQVSFEVAPDGEGGAIWQAGGAPAVDAAGDVYVSTGNANPFPEGEPDPARYAESVVKLDPGLHVLASFKDPRAGGDEDLSTGNPVLLPDGTLFAVGKTNVGYLLRQDDLSLVATIGGVCGSDPDGGPAYDPATRRLFVPCRGGGIQVVDVGRRALGPKLSGADSAPIVVGRSVWAVDHRRGTLTRFDADALRQLQSVPVGAQVPIFTPPTAALGVLLVATDDGVAAFR